MKKQIYSLMMVALLSTTLMACAGSNDDAADDAAANNQPAETREPASPETPRTDVVTVSIPANAAEMGLAALGTQPLEVKVGTTVTWKNDDSVPHTITSDMGLFDSGEIAPGKTFTHTFAEAGTFGYFCAIHGAEVMSGAVQVNP